MTRTSSNDRTVGSSSLVVVMVIAMVTVMLAAAAVVAGLAAVQVRTSQAADLAALAGAEKALAGQEVACAEAGRIVAAHGAQMQRCSWEGLDVQVHVSMPLHVLLLGADVGAGTGAGSEVDRWRLSAVARAGPPADLGLG